MRDVKKILADVDPNASEHFAIERARQLAAASGAAVHLLLSVYDESLTGGVLTDDDKVKQARNDYMAELKDWLEQRSRMFADDGIEVTTEAVWHSPRYESLLDKAEELKADIIIRAAIKHSAIDRLIFAATDWELVRRSPQPVWVVKKDIAPSNGGVKVLVAVDPAHPGDKKADLDSKLVATAKQIVQLLGGELHVFHAYNASASVAPVAAAGHYGSMPVLTIGNDLMEELRAQRSKQIDRLLEPSGIPESNVHVVPGDTKSALEELVDDLQIDVVVAGAVSRGRLERLLIGSTAEAILDTVACDVVVVKPDGFTRSQ